jgi:hypothetical protein
MLGKVPQSVIPPFRPSCITRKESKDLLIGALGDRKRNVTDEFWRVAKDW